MTGPNLAAPPHVQAVCPNGHLATVWGNIPMLVHPGEILQWWGTPFMCACGHPYSGPVR